LSRGGAREGGEGRQTATEMSRITIGTTGIERIWGEEMSESKEKIGNTINQLDLLHRLFIIISATHPLLRASM
jgi:hypothetical protein